MNQDLPPDPPDHQRPHPRLRWRITPVLGVLIAAWWLLHSSRKPDSVPDGNGAGWHAEAGSLPARTSAPVVVTPRGADGAMVPTAEEVVARKLDQFGASRLALVEAMAEHFHVEVRDDVRAFFDAIKRGNWEEIEAAFMALHRRREASPRSPDLDACWRPILDAFGAAEQVHLWPAQKLLDFGNGILAALRPGMVYVGGTDSGCFIPTFLNETGEGEHHIVLTQNCLADATYLNYLGYLYGDRMQTLTDAESKAAFNSYLTDALKRQQHDEQFPNEPKQLRPGENIRMADGKPEVTGPVAVMEVNERLLQMLLAQNPGLSFGYEESKPFNSAYAGALPLGPVMELRATDSAAAFTPERAMAVVDYWRDAAQQILSDPDISASDEALKTYSHTAVAQANLLASRDFMAEAEQAYRLANQLYPGNPEAITALAQLLAKSGRTPEARQLFNDYAQKYPDQKPYLEAQSGWLLTGGPDTPPKP